MWWKDCENISIGCSGIQCQKSCSVSFYVQYTIIIQKYKILNVKTIKEYSCNSSACCCQSRLHVINCSLLPYCLYIHVTWNTDNKSMGSCILCFLCWFSSTWLYTRDFIVYSYFMVVLWSQNYSPEVPGTARCTIAQGLIGLFTDYIRKTLQCIKMLENALRCCKLICVI